MDPNTCAHLIASYFKKISPVKFEEIIASLESPKDLLSTKADYLKKFLRNPILDEFISFRNNFRPDKVYEELSRLKIIFIPKFSPQCPPQLLLCPDAPIGLFVKGNLSLLTQKKLFVAIVGTRMPSLYGKMVATSIIDKFPNDKTIIVSGMALGIDGIAHLQSLKNKIPTIAVLTGGPDKPTPSSHRYIYEKIIANNGAVISEQPPGSSILPSFFLERNRIIAGISSAIVVIEGSEKSGTLSTARWASEYDRPVFAPPHPITSRGAGAPHQLIKQGANFITSGDDILDYFNIDSKKDDDKITLSLSQQNVFNLLTQKNNLTLDAISSILKIESGKLLSLISELELLGIVAKDVDGTYHLCKT